MTDTERMLNIGEEIEVKQLGKVVIRELSLEQTVQCLLEIQALFQEFQKNRVDLILILQKPEMLSFVQTIAHHSTGLPREKFSNLPISAWLKLVAAFKRVIDWEEIQETFFQILPRDTLTT